MRKGFSRPIIGVEQESRERAQLQLRTHLRDRQLSNYNLSLSTLSGRFNTLTATGCTEWFVFLAVTYLYLAPLNCRIETAAASRVCREPSRAVENLFVFGHSLSDMYVIRSKYMEHVVWPICVRTVKSARRSSSLLENFPRADCRPRLRCVHNFISFCVCSNTRVTRYENLLA